MSHVWFKTVAAEVSLSWELLMEMKTWGFLYEWKTLKLP